MKKRFCDLKKTSIFAAGHLKRPAILATLTVYQICMKICSKDFDNVELIMLQKNNAVVRVSLLPFPSASAIFPFGVRDWEKFYMDASQADNGQYLYLSVCLSVCLCLSLSLSHSLSLITYEYTHLFNN